MKEKLGVSALISSASVALSKQFQRDINSRCFTVKLPGYVPINIQVRPKARSTRLLIVGVGVIFMAASAGSRTRSVSALASCGPLKSWKDMMKQVEYCLFSCFKIE